MFALKTTTCIYYCGEREEFDEKGSIIPAEADSGKGIRIGLSWAEIVKNALQPIAMRAEATSAAGKVVTGSTGRSSNRKLYKHLYCVCLPRYICRSESLAIDSVIKGRLCSHLTACSLVVKWCTHHDVVFQKDSLNIDFQCQLLIACFAGTTGREFMCTIIFSFIPFFTIIVIILEKESDKSIKESDKESYQQDQTEVGC